MDRRLRYIHWGFAALLVVSAAQVGYWILDQRWSSNATRSRLVELYEERASLTQAILDSGADPAVALADVDGVVLAEGRAAVDPALIAALDEEQARRLNRYSWEGGFFLAVLLATIGVIATVLRQEATLRRRQHNFLASISHELRSPIAAAMVAAETLELRDPDRDERRQHVARLLRGLRRLESMVENLLDSARIEQGDFVLRPRDAELPSALAPIAAAFAERAQDRGIEFVEEVPEQARAFFDELALRSVARNLLENAFEAVSRTAAPRVALRVRVEGDFVEMTVADNGCGFDPDERQAIFQRFYRPGDEQRRSGHGAGLGLYLARELVQRSGGTISADSSGPDGGATFRVCWRRTAEAM